MATNDEIRRSTLGRFLPACVAGLLTPFLLFSGGDSIGPAQLALILVDIAGLTLGYHVTLKAGKKLIRKLSGLRALAAGAVGPMAAAMVMALFEGGRPFVNVLALSFAITAGTGVWLAATMFLRRGRPRLPETSETRALAGEPLEQWFSRVEREAEREPWYRCLGVPRWTSMIRGESAT